MNAELELPFELAAAYSVARTVPRDKLLLSIHAKNGTSVLRLMGPGLKVELDRWDYDPVEDPKPSVYNFRVNSRRVRREFDPYVVYRDILPEIPEEVANLIRLLLKPENV
jgi:hypothetical protein